MDIILLLTIVYKICKVPIHDSSRGDEQEGKISKVRVMQIFSKALITPTTNV